jgi:uncharacterized protein (DUF1697 family)
MEHPRWRWLSLLVCVWTLAHRASAAEPQKLLVARIDATADRAALASSIEDSLLAELGKHPDVVVVSPAELEQMLAFSKTQAELGCDEVDACVAAVGEKLHADLLIYSKLVPLGKGSVLTLSSMRTSDRSVMQRVATEAADGKSLREALGPLVDSLLGARQGAAQFQLAPGEQLRLAIMPLAANGVPPATAEAMTQILAAEYQQIEGVSVLSREDIRVMLQQVELEAQLGCLDDLQCVAEIGAALGLSRVITGNVAEVDGTRLVSLRMIDTRAATVLSRQVEAFEGDARELTQAVKLAGYRLLGVSLDGKPGGVAWTFNVPTGKATLGAYAFPIRSHQLKLSLVPVGRYSLWVVPDGDGYLPLRTDVFVPPGLNSVRSFELAQTPQRWYQQWWVWAIAGAVVTASATTAVLLNGREDNGQVTVSVPSRSSDTGQVSWGGAH